MASDVIMILCNKSASTGFIAADGEENVYTLFFLTLHLCSEKWYKMLVPAFLQTPDAEPQLSVHTLHKVDVTGKKKKKPFEAHMKKFKRISYTGLFLYRSNFHEQSRRSEHFVP